MNKNKGKIFYGWWIFLGSILVTATIIPSVMSMVGNFQIPITEELGISNSSFALSNTILQGLGIFISPFLSKKLSTGNMKKIQSISIVLFAATLATYGLAQKPIHLYISSFVLGILFLTSAMLPIPMMITNWFEEKRGLAMSLAMGGIGIGGFVFSPLVTSWISNFGWRNAYFIFALVILIVAFPVSAFIFAKRPEDKGLKPYGSENKAINSTTKKTESALLTISSKEARMKPFFFILLLGMVCNGLINTAALMQFPPAVINLHGVTTKAAIVSLYSIIGVFGKILIGWINDKFGLISAILFGGTAFTLSFISMLFGENIQFIYMMAICLGLGMAIGNVLPPLITSEVFGKDKYGDMYGYVNSTLQIGLSLGSLTVASLLDISGTYKTAWIFMTVAAVITVFSWILSYKLSSKYKEKKNIKKEVVFNN